MSTSSETNRKPGWPTVLVRLATLGLIVLATVSFILSFDALLIVASWGHTRPEMRWGVPVFIDGAIVVYTAVVLVQQYRGGAARFPRVMLTLFTMVSVAGNGAVAWSAGDPHGWQTWAGTFIAALPPVGVFAATHMIVRLAVAPHTEAARDSAGERTEHGLRQELEVAEDHGTAPTVPSSELSRAGIPSRSAPPVPLGAASALRQGRTNQDRDARIEELTKKQLSQRQIADELGCGKSTVARVQERLGLIPGMAQAEAVPAA